jgi:D-hexose-6-phosphate mutarotase
MDDSAVDALNARFGIAEHVSFKAGPGGLPVAAISNARASGIVSVLGGQVTAFQPHGHEPVLWVSECSHYEVGSAIRGGIPVCWPWFGPHPKDSSKPSHGFVRTRMWSVLGADVIGNEATQVRLGIADASDTRALWPHRFELEICVAIGKELRVDLVVRNPGSEEWTCTGALHTYLNVGDVTKIAIHGLDGCCYDEDSAEPRLQRGAVTIASEVDRIYFDTTSPCTIEDPRLARRIRIAKAGSHSTVVWNPWVGKARRLQDFGDEEYLDMVCVETANSRHDPVTLPPGGEHRLSAVISVERV